MRSSSVTPYQRGLGTPRGFCDAIEKCAGPNGWLRGGEDPDLGCRQVVREKLQHSVRRTGRETRRRLLRIYCDRRRRTVSLHISRRLADVGRARGDVDERGNVRVISGLRNDRPSITMADEHDRTWLTLDDA